MEITIIRGSGKLDQKLLWLGARVWPFLCSSSIHSDPCRRFLVSVSELGQGLSQHPLRSRWRASVWRGICRARFTHVSGLWRKWRQVQKVALSCFWPFLKLLRLEFRLYFGELVQTQLKLWHWSLWRSQTSPFIRFCHFIINFTL